MKSGKFLVGEGKSITYTCRVDDSEQQHAKHGTSKALKESRRNQDMEKLGVTRWITISKNRHEWARMKTEYINM